MRVDPVPLSSGETELLVISQVQRSQPVRVYLRNLLKIAAVGACREKLDR